MKNMTRCLRGLALGLGLVLVASVALAVQVPENQLLPDPEKTMGGPVAYIQLAPGKEKETAYLEMKKQNQYILGYRELSLLDLNTDRPILVTWTYNRKKGQATKTFFNWKEIDSIQILDPKIKTLSTGDGD